MAVHIWSRAKLLNQLADDGKDVHNVICITEAVTDTPCPPAVPLLSKNHLWLMFDDIEMERPGFTPPTKEHVEKALAFAEGKEDVAVACYAGISRSSAIAYLIQCTRDYHPRLALNVLTPLKHHPNRMIVKIGSELLKDPTIYDEYNKWINALLPSW